MLFDAVTGEKLIAFRAMTPNTVAARVVVKPETNYATVSFGKTKLVLPNEGGKYENGEYVLTLGYNGMDCSKEAVSFNPKQVVAGVVEDADVLGDNTVIYARVDGVEPYFTAIVPGTPKLNIGDKIKFAIKPELITRA